MGPVMVLSEYQCWYPVSCCGPGLPWSLVARCLWYGQNFALENFTSGALALTLLGSGGGDTARIAWHELARAT